MNAPEYAFNQETDKHAIMRQKAHENIHPKLQIIHPDRESWAQKELDWVILAEQQQASMV